MKRHQLKIWPQWFDAIRQGLKTFEIRKDDRNFNIGDDLTLEEFRPRVGEYTGRTIQKRIMYISRGDDAESIGLQPGYCVLGLGVKQ